MQLTDKERQQRLREIEDRKIEILLEIPGIKDNTERISELNDEYVQLGNEYYNLKFELIREKQKT
jgi:hypothetical protein